MLGEIKVLGREGVQGDGNSLRWSGMGFASNNHLEHVYVHKPVVLPRCMDTVEG